MGMKTLWKGHWSVFDTDYIDLMLLHQPAGCYITGYRHLERAYKEGKIKAIGLSNFNEGQIEEIIDCCEIKPVLLQTEVHPYAQAKEIKNLLAKADMAIQAWYPLGHGDKALLEEPLLVRLAEKYNQSQKFPCSRLRGTLILITSIRSFMVYNFVNNLADVFFGKVNIIQFVRPMIGNGDLIDFIKILIDSAFEFLYAGNPDSMEHLLCELAEKTFHQVQPGTVCWRKYEFEPPRHGIQVFLCLSGSMGGMVVKDKAYLIFFRVFLIQYL